MISVIAYNVIAKSEPDLLISDHDSPTPKAEEKDDLKTEVEDASEPPPPDSGSIDDVQTVEDPSLSASEEAPSQSSGWVGAQKFWSAHQKRVFGDHAY